MIQVVIDFIIIYGIFRFRERNSDHDEFFINSFSFAIYGLPRVIDFLIRLAVNFIQLPQWILFLSFSLFFILPVVLLKSVGGFSLKRSISYGVIVIGVVFVNELLIALLFQSISA